MFSNSTEDFVTIAFVFAALATVGSLRKAGWRLWREPLDAAGRGLVVRAAFLLVLPPIVLLHELGHAVMVWAFGGHVLQFAWRIYWGFVVPGGSFSPAQEWAIALAGNIVSIGAGLGLLVAGSMARTTRPAVRYLLLQAGVIEFAFGAVGYPLLSFGGADGDWVIIYDFHRTPVLSTVTLVGHGAMLAAVWWWWRRGGLRDQTFAAGAKAPARLPALTALVHADPTNVDARAELARFYLENGDAGLAIREARAARTTAGDVPELWLIEGVGELSRSRFGDAAKALRRGLEATGDEGDLAQRLWANLGIALAAAHKGGDAREAFSHVQEPLASNPAVQHWRTQVGQ